MRQFRRLISRTAAVSLLLLLSACGPNYGAVVVGTWKDISQERYLTIEENVDYNAASTSDTLDGVKVEQFSARIYAPINSDAQSDESQTTMSHLSMPAKLQDGILMLQLEAGDVAVLYNPNSEQVVLNGTDTYERVPEKIAQLKLASVRNTNH